MFATSAHEQGFFLTFKICSADGHENLPARACAFHRARGNHVLHRDENGLGMVVCFLCARCCPANCIYIEAAENTDANRIFGGERYASGLQYRLFRCILRLCVKHVQRCVTHAHGFELAT